MGVVLLVFVAKHFVTTWIQGGTKAKAGGRPPEDTTLLKTECGFLAKKVEEDSPEMQAKLRWARIVANDLEWIPLGLITALASLLVVVDSHATAHVALMWIFVASRLGHPVSFAYAKQ